MAPGWSTPIADSWYWPRVPKPEWARRGWTWLHGLAIRFPQEPTHQARARALAEIWRFFNALPCAECRFHATAYYRTVPPDVSSGAALQVWAWRFHNAVNIRLHKPFYPFEVYRAEYGEEISRAEWGDGCAGAPGGSALAF